MPPDFQRDIYCVLGLPFDAITQAAAEEFLRGAVRRRERCFFSTPNLNFIVACRNDTFFRESVLQSDLSVADGWPIVTVAKLVGIPLPERVAGSTLFESLCVGVTSLPIRIYFFGGPECVAETACERLNSSSTGARCVGFEAPGFGDIETMSGESTIQRMNDSGADFVVVALGAKKGHAWILHNLHRIAAPLVSHLGAVVNFAAGTVARAPYWVQRLRLEWAWRIKEEPALWRRYVTDGWALLHMLATRVVGHRVHLCIHRPSRATLAAAQATAESGTNGLLVRLNGAWSHANLQPLRDLLQILTVQPRSVGVDLSAVTYLDDAAVGLLLLLHGWNLRLGAARTVTAASTASRRLLCGAGAGYLLGPRADHTD